MALLVPGMAESLADLVLFITLWERMEAGSGPQDHRVWLDVCPGLALPPLLTPLDQAHLAGRPLDDRLPLPLFCEQWQLTQGRGRGQGPGSRYLAPWRQPVLRHPTNSKTRAMSPRDRQVPLPTQQAHTWVCLVRRFQALGGRPGTQGSAMLGPGQAGMRLWQLPRGKGYSQCPPEELERRSLGTQSCLSARQRCR